MLYALLDSLEKDLDYAKAELRAMLAQHSFDATWYARSEALWEDVIRLTNSVNRVKQEIQNA